MAKSKVLTKAQRKLSIDYLISESEGHLSAAAWEDFYSKRPSDQRLMIYERAKAWARGKPSQSSAYKEPNDSKPQSSTSDPGVVPESLLPSAPRRVDVSPSEGRVAGNKKPFLVHLSDHQISALKYMAERTGESRAHHVRAALNSYIKTYIGDSNDDN